MNQTLLSATWRVETMVGREKQLEQIGDAIYGDPESKCCRVVLVKGPGGIGKSRLLEEVQWRAGHSPTRNKTEQTAIQQQIRDDWSESGDVVISDIVDLMDIRLSVRTEMLQALGDALTWQEGVDFSDYESAKRAHLRALEGSADSKAIRARAEEAEMAFWKAFSEQADKRRFVLIFDTAERLILRSSRWLLDRELLKDDELRELSSQQWLLWQLQQGRFQNTTLIIAGRDGEEEGGPFFDQIQAVVNDPATPCSLIKVRLDPLDVEETAAYFNYAAKEWEERTATIPNGHASPRSDIERVSRTMRALASDDDRLKSLHAVTGGRPVLLSLYGDLIHETEEIPHLLQLTSAEIDAVIAKRGQAELQAEIERSFINLLFQRTDLRSDIMQALARCPAGLDAEQLHLIIDGIDNENIIDWKPNTARVEVIDNEINKIRQFSISKPRSGRRMGLQDEVYRIYAERMSENKDLRDYERKARLRQYLILSKLAKQKLEGIQERLQKYQKNDETNLIAAIHAPVVALRPYWQSPTATEQGARLQIQQEIRDWELERLHYDLLEDPTAGFNDSYGDLAEQQFRANNEEAEFVIQQEMWRVLHDRYSLKFTDLYEDKLEILRRAARQEDPARWIKRFVLRRDFNRAVELFQAVEAAILKEEGDARSKWRHSLNRGERLIWKNYAKIMRGDRDLADVVDRMELELSILKRLANVRSDQEVQRIQVMQDELKELEGKRKNKEIDQEEYESKRDLIHAAIKEEETMASADEEEKEYGFQNHVALPRLQRIIASGYNFAGYGRVVLGRYGKGVGNYVQALLFARKTQSKALEAAIRNNLGRALASLGRDERGYLVCADGLALWRRMGAEIPIAYSLNTLALIGNGMQRTPTAWREAAQAAAIFRRAGDNRGLGLSLIQLGIGLRRLANSYEPTVILDATPDELYTTAQRALGEAVDIFEKDPEILRRVEARLELACVLRDQLRLQSVRSNPARVARLHRDSELEFGRAIQMARERGFKHLALQAQVDLAWAHFFAGHLSTAEKEIEEASTAINRNYVIELGEFIPQKQDETHFYYQKAKIEGLRAALAMTRFKARREQLRREQRLDTRTLNMMVDSDAESNRQMNASATAYVLSLAYGQIYSPRSRSLAITFDQIYDHLKEFNVTEYRIFRHYAKGPQVELKKAQDRTFSIQANSLAYDFSNLDQWLDDCFGPLESESKDE